MFFVYIYKDEESLTFLKDKSPQSAIMFVCNKVDITREARQFDNDEEEDEEEDDGNSSESNQTRNAEDKTVDKGKKFSHQESNL